MKRKFFDYYLKSISRRWKIEVRKATEKVIVLSPYLTSKTAEVVLDNLHNKQCEVYTVFSVQNFASGASSLKSLKLLFERGCMLYHLPRLHAKMIIIPNTFASIGSQNLTRNGVKNKEASVAIYNHQEVAKIEKDVQKWFLQRQVITIEMIKELETKLIALRRKYSLLKREANNLESEIWAHEHKRIEDAIIANEAERQREEEVRLQKEIIERAKIEQGRIQQEIENPIKLTEKEEWIDKVNAGRVRVMKLSEHGEVERSLAEEFIRKSAYWDHPIAHRFVRAPGHTHRIYGYKNNWRIDFGANTFLIGHAICRCQQTLLEFLDKYAYGYVISLAEIREKLKNNVLGAVANSQGYEYEGYYSGVDNDYMRFGVQAININDFVNLVLSKVQLNFFD